MTDPAPCDPAHTLAALAELGRSGPARRALFRLLREAEGCAPDPATYREDVRWPLICAALAMVRTHRVTLENGLVFEVAPDSRIERALLLSREEQPDHVWEPQTTKLLAALAAPTRQVIVGGAYIGDQVLPIARALGDGQGGLVHAFEAMSGAFRRLLRNIELNAQSNIVPRHLALWDRSGVTLAVDGPPALARCIPVGTATPGEHVQSITIDDYIEREALHDVGLIMLDLEGGEQRALRGAGSVMALPAPAAPHLVFEVHSDHVDWSRGLSCTPPVALVASHGYTVYAVRDYHDNVRVKERPIEIIPVTSAHLEGPAHGFNMLAVKQTDVVARLGLKIVRGVSPKLLAHGDPRLHHPLH